MSKRFDAATERFEVIELFSRKALFTPLRIDKATVPTGLHLFEICHGDDMGEPVTLERGVTVNHYGTVLSDKRLLSPHEDYRDVGWDDFAFSGKIMSVFEYLTELNKRKSDIER